MSQRPVALFRRKRSNHDVRRLKARKKAVIPTSDQRILDAGTAALGGRWGRHAAAAVDKVQFFTLPRVLILLTTLAGVIAVATKQHCLLHGAGAPGVYLKGCYSDWTALYSARGLAAEPWAPFTTADFEYPVLMSVVASVTAWLVPEGLTGQGAVYWGINFAFAFILWVGIVLLTAKTAGWRPWDAAMVALAPGIILAGSINWDLWAVALLSAAMYFASRGKPIVTGVFIGLGTAMKLYPLFLLGAFLVLAVRKREWKRFATITGAAAAAWLLVNLPLMIGNWAAFIRFYEFSSERGPSWSSLWHIWNVIADANGLPSFGAELGGLLATGLFALSCLAIFLVAITTPQPPRLAQLMFLIVAAFVLFNKVYSPQFVVWMIPLFVLAAPRWKDFALWQFVEVLHFWAVWMMLARSFQQDWPEATKMDESVYVLAVLAHVAAVIWLIFRVLRDMYEPRFDPVLKYHASDPGLGFSQPVRLS